MRSEISVSVIPAEERRRYRRLDQIFPVEFQLLDETGAARSDWRQGFTQDVSDGGLCLTLRLVSPGDVERLKARTANVALRVHIPYRATVPATARPVWLRCVEEGLINTYVAGLDYQAIDGRDLLRMRRYIGVRRFIKAVFIVCLVLLSTGLALLAVTNARLRLENERFLRELTQRLGYQQTLERDRVNLAAQLDKLEFDLAKANREINFLGRNIEETKRQDKEDAAVLQASLDFYKKYQEQLRRDIEELNAQSAEVERQAKAADQAAAGAEKEAVGRFNRWLLVHRNRATGLLPSFEGDAAVRDWAFTYDQALAAIVFLERGETEEARRILDFYRTARRSDDGGFLNAYYAATGDPAEYIAHAGPNLWLGIAVLQYTARTHDTAYLGIARDIARWLATLTDAEGGIRGGPAVAWYSTEHHLDAYAFYRMLAAVTGGEEDDALARRTLAWLTKNAFSRLADPVVRRGKGDATVATDTYAWSIAAVGPVALGTAGMDPDQIMDFARTQCAVTTNFKKADGTTVRVRGFDFAREKNLPRGGVVSCEWTAQMIMSFKIMAAYHASRGDEESARYYTSLAHAGMAELMKMAVASPSPVGQGDFCLPYASHELADTGHGWSTPRGNSTGSVAATAYAILVMEDFNPLALGGK
ncbi:MAG: hypothetical protein ACM3L6_00195 [Deltaproteobacteria bacterium]